jgi:hypothetical protein
MFIKDGNYRFVYMSGPEAPELFPLMSAEAINLPSEQILNTAHVIPDGNQGEILLNDCLTMRVDDPNNPLNTFEGADAFLNIIAGIDANYPRLNEMRAAIMAKHDIQGHPNLTNDQIEAELANYRAILNVLKSSGEVREEAEGEVADLDRLRYEAYNYSTEFRNNWRAMSEGQKNALAGTALAGLIWVFANKEHPLAIALRKDIVGLVGFAGAAVAVDSGIRLATGRGGIELVEEINRNSGESMAGYFGMPYNTPDQRRRMNDVCSILAEDHNELFGDDVSFAQLYEAWQNDDVESISRRGIFAERTGAMRLKQALTIIFEKFAPGREGSIYDENENPVLASVFGHITNKDVEVTPMEGLTDLILADPEAPRRLMTTVTDRVVDATIDTASTVIDYGADLGGDIAVVANHHVVDPALDAARIHISPVLQEIAANYSMSREWLDRYSDYIRRVRGTATNREAISDFEIPEGFFAGVPANTETERPYSDEVEANIMHIGIWPSADFPTTRTIRIPDVTVPNPIPDNYNLPGRQPVNIPFANVQIPNQGTTPLSADLDVPGGGEELEFDLPTVLQTAFVVRSDSGRKYLVTDSKMFEDGLGNFRLVLRSDEHPEGIDITDNAEHTFDQYGAAIIEIPDSMDLGVNGLDLASNMPDRGDALWGVYDSNNAPRSAQGTRYFGNYGDHEEIFGTDSGLDIDGNWFTTPSSHSGEMRGAPILDSNGRVVGLTSGNVVFSDESGNEDYDGIAINSLLIRQMIADIENDPSA